jgi:HEPN domain-containing protein
VTVLKLLRVAKSYLRQAGARLRDAKDAFSESNYPYAVRLSQECVELSLKAVLKAVGIEYPKIHDVSDVLLDVEDRFPAWFRDDLKFLCESLRVLVKKRELSLYGGEESFLTPDEVMNEEDAEDATARAERTYGLCERLVLEVEKRHVKAKP